MLQINLSSLGTSKKDLHERGKKKSPEKIIAQEQFPDDDRAAYNERRLCGEYVSKDDHRDQQGEGPPPLTYERILSYHIKVLEAQLAYKHLLSDKYQKQLEAELTWRRKSLKEHLDQFFRKP
jgi:hypothetical protein